MFLGEDMVGYMRLRHGHFTVECPDVGGAFVYRAYPNGDGSFDDDERDYYLQWAVDNIQRWRLGAVNVPYEVVKE